MLAQALEPNPLLRLLCIALALYFWVLFARVLLSWAHVLGFRTPYSGPLRRIVDLLYDLTEPVLAPLRRLIPPVRMGAVGLDLSIIVVFVVLAVLQRALC